VATAVVVVLATAVLLASLASARPASGPTAANPAPGKKLFVSLGCGVCHTMRPAGTHGTVGPNLDQFMPPYAGIVRQITHGGGGMPAFGKRLTRAQLRDLAAFVYKWTSRP
jgi:sulfite dehydrogenase